MGLTCCFANSLVFALLGDYEEAFFWMAGGSFFTSVAPDRKGWV